MHSTQASNSVVDEIASRALRNERDPRNAYCQWKIDPKVSMNSIIPIILASVGFDRNNDKVWRLATMTNWAENKG